MGRLKQVIGAALCALIGFQAKAVNTDPLVVFRPAKGSFPLVEKGKAVPLAVAENEWPGVRRAANDLAADILRVTDIRLALFDAKAGSADAVVIGTIGHSALIDKLIADKRIDVTNVRGKWESSVTQIVENPMPGVKRALVIAGSDKRGTIYGIYSLSAAIGVSPWYYWADVPAAKQSALYVLPGRHPLGEPSVKYRGIFLNDEAPALSGWSKEKFGGFNHQFYEKVFELILRLKGNYLWPAMWGNAFNDDDKQNPVLADEYGVVMGTSHHEPMQRAQQEWKRFGKGEWNYEKNDSVLAAFWKQGIVNMKDHESLVTIGMRGDGDMPMSQGSNVDLLERIVKDQRKLIADVTGKPATATPQLWALYKEVQDYYDKGMRVPDDVTLLLCDDNWGNLRKLPKVTEAPHPGGYGIYYHFDYVGGPRNYKWVNTNPIAKVWEQMNLAKAYGADRIWIVNVGDLKPMEFPIEFFLDFAWDNRSLPADKLQEYTKKWAANQFGDRYAADIADLISTYTKYNGRRKPELLSPTTYSLVNYREYERIVADYNALAKKAEAIGKQLPAAYYDAYFQLVEHPIAACANLNDLFFTVAQNRWYATQKRSETNVLAKKAQTLFDRDQALSRKYNTEISGGKWPHMMDQTHISYTGWQQPNRDVLPRVDTISVPLSGALAVSVEESNGVFPLDGKEVELPAFNENVPARYFELFNTGKTPVAFALSGNTPWASLSVSKGSVSETQRVWVTVDWKKAPAGKTRLPLVVSADGKQLTLVANIDKRSQPVAGRYLPSKFYMTIPADKFVRAVNSENIEWRILPDHGRTGSAVTTFPVTAATTRISATAPHLEYEFSAQDTGLVTINTYVSPAIDFTDTDGLQFAISFDNETPQIVSLHRDRADRAWDRSVSENIRMLTSRHTLKTAGKHVLKVWRVDPAVVFQQFVLNSGGLKDSYLGPPPVTLSSK